MRSRGKTGRVSRTRWMGKTWNRLSEGSQGWDTEQEWHVHMTQIPKAEQGTEHENKDRARHMQVWQEGRSYLIVQVALKQETGLEPDSQVFFMSQDVATMERRGLRYNDRYSSLSLSCPFSLASPEPRVSSRLPNKAVSPSSQPEYHIYQVHVLPVSLPLTQSVTQPGGVSSPHSSSIYAFLLRPTATNTTHA